MAEQSIIVKTTINAPLSKVWEAWTKADHITHWNFAADTWHCPKAKNDLNEGGRFSWRMEAKDGSVGFDYAGTYHSIDLLKKISLSLDDGRKVLIEFIENNDKVTVVEAFEIEDVYSVDQQKAGWQAILNNFKSYVEGL
ncbi:MAG: polyketide cyclase [Saprospiraceae bacterium]|nr:polyketide cyclase [Saprospiraceae bacterium]